MDEEKTKTEEHTPANTGEGVQPETTTELDRADQIAERQDRVNKKHEELIEREEALEARRAVGGKSEAGSEPVKKKEISNEDYAKKVMSGKDPNAEE